MREKESEIDRERREKERGVARWSSLGHVACLSSFPLEDFAMLTLKMDGWRRRARAGESPRLVNSQRHKGHDRG